MKYHSIFTFAFSSFCLLTSQHTYAADRTNGQAIKDERWFEIEIILFKHTSKNSDKTEQFLATELNAKKRRTFDLLAPYLQADIASLKQLLPNCEQPNTQAPYDISITPYELWPATDDIDNIAATLTSDTALSDNESEQLVAQTQGEDDKEVGSAAAITAPIISDAQSELFDKNIKATTAQDLVDLTAESYHAKYASIELPVYTQYPINSQAPLCVIPADFFQQHLTTEQLTAFNIDGFPVERVPNTINGIEQWIDNDEGEITWASHEPYLISQDSLRLKSIANRIKRDRNYTPLLHLGWRQIGETRNKATAMKLYAGDHLELGYQQAIAKQETALKLLEIEAILARSQMDSVTAAREQLLTSNSLDKSMPLELVDEDIDPFTELSIAEQLRLQAKQQQLEHIFQQYTLLDRQLEAQTIIDQSTVNTADNSTSTNTNTNKNNDTSQSAATIEEVITQLSSGLSVEETKLSVSNSIDTQLAIAAPLQPWLIDGLFKVHLNRYLYINTELTIIDSPDNFSKLSATQQLANNNVITFKQDRRVITGEIHYFDHPYIGMVVQIRRFDPNKPADEAVTQAKK